MLFWRYSWWLWLVFFSRNFQITKHQTQHRVHQLQTTMISWGLTLLEGQMKAGLGCPRWYAFFEHGPCAPIQPNWYTVSDLAGLHFPPNADSNARRDGCFTFLTGSKNLGNQVVVSNIFFIFTPTTCGRWTHFDDYDIFQLGWINPPTRKPECSNRSHFLVWATADTARPQASSTVFTEGSNCWVGFEQNVTWKKIYEHIWDIWYDM